MHRLILFYVAIVLASACVAQQVLAKAELRIKVTNSLDEDRTDALVQVPVKAAVQDWSTVKLVAGESLIPFEPFDTDGDGVVDRLDILLQMNAGETKEIAVLPLAKDEKAPVFEKRTYAEISHKVGGYWKGNEYMEGTFKNVDLLEVPPEHTDHSWYIRYEGPGWESDLVGYRFYLDWRNANDIFGKTTKELALSQVGLDGFDSYHAAADWGMDILKVGNSLGIGSIATWVDGKAMRVAETDSLACEIVKNGTLESLVRTQYIGWKVAGQKTDLTSDLSIHAGSRLTKVELTLASPLDNLCTGIGKLDNTEVFSNQEGEWNYLATWGEQSLAQDKLGMAVFYRKDNLASLTEDELNHVLVLDPEKNKLVYYFLAAWEQEPGGIKDKDSFLAYLAQTARALNAPLTTTVAY